MRRSPACTVLIYDQTCAAEKRRRRKRGTFPDPDKRVIINELVCEGCGDCGVQIELRLGAAARDRVRPQAHHRPVELQQGLLLREGLLPVVRHRARRASSKKGTGVAARPRRRWRCPSRRCRRIGQTYNIIVTGVGGTGIVTIGGILGMAAHLEGKGVGVIDMAGLAQKGGAVYSHMRIAERPEDIHAIRVAAGGADLVLGGDIVVAGNKKVLAAVKHGKTEMVVNTAEFLPGDFTRNADFSLPTERLKRAIVAAPAASKTHFIDASRLADRAVRRSLGANIFLVGYAYQLGALPLSAGAIEQAIALNGEAVPMNLAAFHWGRRAALEPRRRRGAGQARAEQRRATTARCRSRSTRRSSAASRSSPPIRMPPMRARYRRLVEKVKAAEAASAPGQCGLAEAVARYLFKLMAYKDEYEVARLYTDGTFLKQVASELGGDNLRFEFHLAPPLLARTRPGDRRAAQDELRSVDDARVQAAGEVQVPARHAVRSVRLFEERRTERKLIARLRGDARRGARQARRRQPSTSRSGSPRSRKKSAASATSSCATSTAAQGRRGGAARAVPLRHAAAAQGGGIAFLRRATLRPGGAVAANRRRPGHAWKRQVCT